ncbi:MAG: aminopeptidase P family protein [Bacillati bacterium ANGP1]|uniref:Aminopeptidase P family protein n=1 Tax=Candidatus Segetimicrobium genomatis TaxID=2569760 RepID=A0A537IT25_9BACT|nr:MAG: aminopeptidase P family protein [Terrabacteria group bacterium ANGP1]
MYGYAEGRTGPAPRKLTATVIAPAEVSLMHRQRVENTRAAMAHHGIDMLAVPPGEDLRYLANFSTLADERPSYLFLTADAALFLVPELNAQQSRAHIQDPMLTYTDAEGPGKALAAARARLGSAHRIGAGDTMRADALLLLQHQWRDGEFVPASIVLAPLRMRKSSEEIEALRRAAATADAAVQAAWRACRPGVTEADIAGAVDAGFRAAGATEVKSAIVGSGPNSAFPHHHTGTRRTQAGEPVLYDLGSRVDGYCSDITRMAFLGEPSARYQQVHRAVEAAVQKALAVIRPGVPIKDVDLAARRTIEEAGFGPNFVHRTGHGIGLSEHEPPSVTHANDLPIEEGMAFSVEPGIYLPGEFGVRLEEIVVVTARGADVLSRLPRDLKVIS